MSQIETAGDMDGWPKNQPSLPTQTAVFGIKYPGAGAKITYDILWTGKFPTLEPAMYWAAKKEMDAVRRKKYEMASRVLWQHDLTPEEAVAQTFKLMEPQLRRSADAADMGFDPEAALFSDPAGPMKPIDYSKVDKFYVEFDLPDGPLDGSDPMPPRPRNPRGK
jgi:hypothetical protein